MASSLSATIAVAAVALVAPSPASHAQTFPTKPVRLVVPYVAGGVADGQARVIAQALQERWSMSVVVENKAGGLTIPGTDAVAKASPDCHTLLLSGLPVPLNAVTQKLPYDPKTDLAPVTYISSVPNLLVVPAASPFKSLADLVDHAQKHPGTLTFGSTGIGGTSHLAAELLASLARLETVHVPYRGGAAAYSDLMTGRIDFMFDSSSAENVAAGRLRALAITSEKRSPRFPDVPTVAESGYPNFSASAWFAIWTTGGSPRACVDKVSADVNAVLRSPPVSQRFLLLGAEPIGTSPEDAARHQDAEAARWSSLIRERGIQMN